MPKRFSAVALVPALTLCAPTTQAQEAPGDWKQAVFIYGMGAAIDDDAQIGNLKLPVDVSISELFDALSLAPWPPTAPKTMFGRSRAM